MKIELRRITRPVRFRDYAEEYGDEVKIHCWVNPSRAKRLELQALGTASAQARDRLNGLLEQAAQDGIDEDAKEQIAAEVTALTDELETVMANLFEWYADLWSQHPDADTHWTPDDVRELVAACQDNDPALWDWLQDQSIQAMVDHRQGIRKNLPRTA